MAGQSSNPSPLALLGFSPADEDAYRLLLRRAPVSTAELESQLALDPDELMSLLTLLSHAGLVEVAGGTVTVTPPEVGLNRFIAEQTRRLLGVREQLESLRGMIPDLAAERGAERLPPGTSVTLRTIRADDAVPVLQEIAARVPGDLLWFRPDQWRLPTSDDADEWVRGLLREGRRSRVIYPARALEEAPASVLGRAELGEDVRVLADLPFRLAVIGESVAMIPRRSDLADDVVLVLEQPSLVASLTLVFESLWDRALVVPGLGAEADSARDSARRLLLDQLARGAKDEQIARTLGQSLRTVRRRVADVMLELDATSRFQAGVEAVRRGWL